MDMAALMKLTQSDQALVIGLIMLSTRFVQDLIAQRIAIHRPWVSWAEFAKEASELTSLMIKAMREKSDLAKVANLPLPKQEAVSQELIQEQEAAPISNKKALSKPVAKKTTSSKAATQKTVVKAVVSKKRPSAKVAPKVVKKKGAK